MVILLTVWFGVSLLFWCLTIPPVLIEKWPSPWSVGVLVVSQLLTVIAAITFVLLHLLR